MQEYANRILESGFKEATSAFDEKICSLKDEANITKELVLSGERRLVQFDSQVEAGLRETRDNFRQLNETQTRSISAAEDRTLTRLNNGDNWLKEQLRIGLIGIREDTGAKIKEEVRVEVGKLESPLQVLGENLGNLYSKFGEIGDSLAKLQKQTDVLEEIVRVLERKEQKEGNILTNAIKLFQEFFETDLKAVQIKVEEMNRRMSMLIGVNNLKIQD